MKSGKGPTSGFDANEPEDFGVVADVDDPSVTDDQLTPAQLAEAIDKGALARLRQQRRPADDSPWWQSEDPRALSIVRDGTVAELAEAFASKGLVVSAAGPGRVRFVGFQSSLDISSWLDAFQYKKANPVVELVRANTDIRIN